MAKNKNNPAPSSTSNAEPEETEPDETTPDDDVDDDDEVDDEDDDEDDEVDPVANTAPAPAPRAPGNKTRELPARAIAQIRAKEREKGRRLVLAELDSQARTKGYGSWEDLVNKAEPAGAPGRKEERKELQRLRSEQERLLEERRTLNSKLNSETRKRTKLERQLQEQESRFALASLARDCGVTDPEYAVTLFRRQIAGLEGDALAKFDQKAYFTKELRDTHPHLYKTVVKPADTSPSHEEPAPGGAPPADPPAQIDARKMSRQEFDDHLRKRGLSPN